MRTWDELEEKKNNGRNKRICSSTMCAQSKLRAAALHALFVQSGGLCVSHIVQMTLSLILKYFIHEF